LISKSKRFGSAAEQTGVSTVVESIATAMNLFQVQGSDDTGMFKPLKNEPAAATNQETA
jgi:hypothetical protein